ncbi:MAG: FAD-binding protein [Gammaproteobacteria bacterium]|nr:FAD-binding protein [Gammaproteobacteria bacterium]MCP5417655.1 FAD-binding protein [Chromatiaceae bacterium]
MQISCQNLKRDLSAFIPAARLIDDPLRTLAYGSDASFYRLIPELVVKVKDEREMQRIILLAGRHQVPVTFRAAGTSLSGQAISDSVLLLLSGEGWCGHTLDPTADTISLQPGVIGAQANEYLAPYGRKIGPDPASINAAKIGGIAANNASGMCCGTAQNSYNTLAGMRLILADGTLVDTRRPESVARFQTSHGELLQQLATLGRRTRGNSELADRIRHKYRLKNTTGYSLNALVDFVDPLEILQHLMIGSEGTLGFISEISYRTVPEHPCKATALILFPDIESACRAVAALKQAPVTAVELMDRAALRSVEQAPGMPVYLRQLSGEAAALLVDTRAENLSVLQQQVDEIQQVLAGIALVQPAEFTFDPVEYQSLWNIRKGLFPAVGAVRATGTTVIIEDVAFPVQQLAAAVRELQSLFKKYHYHEALIFGHALEGNLHFVFTQDFGSHQEILRYQGLMEEVCSMVVSEFQGSLKAEHGTGRNMAPFVELEWGSDAYALMWEIKRLLDPRNLLNPGVILNQDHAIHLKHLKPLPAADALVDKCIECGFCEAVCPSRDLTLTPRQRIISWREINRLQADASDAGRLHHLRRDFSYQGVDTCAADGLCALRCPVGIDTGRLVKQIRQQGQGAVAQRTAGWVSRNFATLERLTRSGLRLVGAAQDLLGDRNMGRISRTVRRLSGNRLPLWTPVMPRAATKLTIMQHPQRDGSNGRVVYFPSCVSRTLAPDKRAPYQDPLHQRIQSLLAKAGFAVVFPAPVEGLCCGMPLASKGLPMQADESLRQLEQRLWDATGEGLHPVLCDTSPCTLRMIEGISKPLKFYEPAGFISEYLLPHLKLVRQRESVALHITCSSRKMSLDQTLLKLARLCAREVFIPEEKGCCGFAGDKGFTLPELNAAALSKLRSQLPEGCDRGVSNSRTCEIGLSEHSGIPYQSIVYLMDECCASAEPP